MRSTPQPGEIYRHFKGNEYQILTLAKDSETGKEVVVYKAMYGEGGAWVRDLEMFMSPVDKEKYPDVSRQWRFELRSDGTEESSLLMRFLDTEDMKEKLEILIRGKEQLTDDMIDAMAVTLDQKVAPGPVAERMEVLKQCLETKIRFESDRR